MTTPPPRVWVPVRSLCRWAPCVALLACVVGPPASARADALSDAADVYLLEQARALRAEVGATERVRGDVDGRPGDELLVLYVLEGPLGGNSWVQRLAVFGIGPSGRARVLATVDVGARGVLDVQRVERVERGGAIVLSVQGWLPDDAECCPSAPVVQRTCRPLRGRECHRDRLAR